MKEQKLKYKQAFSLYRRNFLDVLARKAFDFHLQLTRMLGNVAPDSWKFAYENHRDFIDFHMQKDTASSPIPEGYNPKKKEVEPGQVTLDFLDLYDFLPKENFHDFKKSIVSYRKKNAQSRFGPYMSAEEFDKLDRLEEFTDTESFYHIIDYKITKNPRLKKMCSQFSIKIISLSPSFLIVQYRFFMSKNFNDDFNNLIRKKYTGYFDTVRPAQLNWLNPWRTAYTFYDGDDERQRRVCDSLSRAKWEMYKEIQKNFGCNFGREHKFPPCFETYQTNILPSEDRNSSFWRSILIDTNFMEYSADLNMCISWNFTSQKAPIRLQAIQGKSDDYSKTIMLSEISNEYAVYLVATAFNQLARFWMTQCNKDIGREMRKSKSKSILNTRLKIEKKLYYSRRFVLEFKSNLNECHAINRFKPAHLKAGNNVIKIKSFTEQAFNSIDDTISNTSKMIDKAFSYFNSSVESNNTYFSYKTTQYALIISIISLGISIMSEMRGENFSSVISNILKYVLDAFK